MERDPEAPRGGYTTKSYLSCLREGLLPYYRPRDIFMQDNARIHTSRTARAFFADYRINLIN
jgi:hypothetical protein